MIAALVITLILAYTFVAGAVSRTVYVINKRRCEDCNSTNRFSYCLDMHEMPAIFAGAGWPLTLPAVAGFWLSMRLTDGEARLAAKADREERKHRQRITEIEAQQKLAREQKEKTIADIRFLTENGIHAEVPGLYDGDVS